MRLIAFAALALALPGTAHAQDAAAGEKVFTACRACHQVGPNARNMTGPVLNGVIGRKAGTFWGYGYTAANKNSGLLWDEPTFRDYIRDPKALLPGTKMVFAGIKSDKQVSDLIAFLRQYDLAGQPVAPPP